MLDMWQPELGRVHLRFNTALRWCAGLLVLSWLLPVRVAWDHTLWSWSVLNRLSAAPGVLAPLVMAAVAVGLSRLAKLDALRKAAIGLVVFVAGSWCVSANPDTGEALFYGLPPQLRTNGWLLTLALISAGTASMWIGGPRQGSRATQPARMLSFISLGLIAALLLWPTRGSFLLGAYARSAWGLVSQSGFLVPTSSLAVNLVLALLPLVVPEVAVLRALNGKASRLGWTVALPPFLILMWAMKIAVGGGGDATFWVGVRVALLFSAQLIFGVFALHSVLAQLLDVHVPEALARGGLLRDALLARALRDGRDVKTAADEFRSAVGRLVRERYDSLSLVNRTSRTGDDVHQRILLRLSGWLQEDVQPLSSEAVNERLSRAKAPRVAGWVMWIAKGRRLEALAGATAVIVVAGSVAASVLLVPKAPEWKLDSAPTWAKELYEQDLPWVAITVGRRVDEEGKQEFVKAVEKAVQSAQPVPALAAAIRELSALIEEPGTNRRAIARVGERLNDAARAAHLPFYADANVLGYFDRKHRRSYVFYLKTYTIEQARIARAGRGSFEALWLERLDATNVAEQRMGWRKLGAPYAMVIQDVIREFWINTMLPTLTGEDGDDATLGEAQQLRDDVVQALAEQMPLSEAQTTVNEGLRCHTFNGIAETDDEGPSEAVKQCTEKELTLQAKMVPVLARMVEGHELQHQIDGESLRPPDAVWRVMGSFADEAVLRATNELSAYLAEIARSPRPRIALAHFQQVGTAGYGTPEFFAWQVAMPVLAEGLADPSELRQLDTETLRQRARDAYARLFGSTLPMLAYER